VAEDEPTINALIEEHLTDAGYRVTTAVDGLDALLALSTARFDVVLTDIRMPRLDGVGLVRHLREEHPQLPVVVFSGHMSEQDRHALLRMRVPSEAILEKPFAFSKLHDAIQMALRRAASQSLLGQGYVQAEMSCAG
jgi:DNA-binding response OmpR family regulator